MISKKTGNLQQNSFLTDDKVRINYYTQGSATDYVLLLHGFSSNTRINWISSGWFDRLVANGFHVIGFDHRGHGYSDKLYDRTRYGADRMALDAVNLLSHLAIDKTHLLGYSMGARVAAFICLSDCAKVKKAVFGGLAYGMITGMSGTEEIIRAFQLTNKKDLASLSVQARSFLDFSLRLGNDLQAMAACLGSSRKRISEQDIKSIRQPILAIAGENDSVAGDLEKFGALLQNGKTVTLKNADHMNSVTHEQFFNHTIEFLKN